MARRDFTTVRDKFARDNGLPFGRLLSREYVLSVLESEGHKYRNRMFCPLTTLWAWLSQCLSQDKSLREVVSRVVAHRVATGLPACSPSSSAYTQARNRFPLSVMQRMAKEIGAKVHGAADDAWNWRGRDVFLADGTGLSMPDTPENQLVYPQPLTQQPGIGFPIMRAVALISLATGAVVDLAFGKHKGKGTGELTLLQSMIGSMDRGSVLVADRYYPTFGTIATLQRAGVDLVSISHHAREVDFSAGHVLGPKDHIVAWHRPKQRTGRQQYENLPDTVLVREFEIDIEERTKGGWQKAIVVTTMIDPAIPQKELSDLYLERWNCELDLRAIKQTMQMGILRGKTPDMVRKEIWCHMLAYNLLRGTMAESAKQIGLLPRQISIKGTMQAVESFTPAMRGINGSEGVYNAFLTTVSAHRVGNRPGRLEPRYKKRRQTWRILMTIPRNKSRRRLAAAGRISLS